MVIFFSADLSSKCQDKDCYDILRLKKEKLTESALVRRENFYNHFECRLMVTWRECRSISTEFLYTRRAFGKLHISLAV